MPERKHSFLNEVFPYALWIFSLVLEKYSIMLLETTHKLSGYKRKIKAQVYQSLNYIEQSVRGEVESTVWNIRSRSNSRSDLGKILNTLEEFKGWNPIISRNENQKRQLHCIAWKGFNSMRWSIIWKEFHDNDVKELLHWWKVWRVYHPGAVLVLSFIATTSDRHPTAHLGSLADGHFLIWSKLVPKYLQNYPV